MQNTFLSDYLLLGSFKTLLFLLVLFATFYINKKMIIEVGLDVSSGGRRPELIELNARGGYVVGVDLGPTHLRAMVADQTDKAASKVVRERPAGRMEELTPAVISIIEEAIRKSGLEAG